MSEARFAKRARLLKAIEFRHVFDKPIKSSDRFFTVLARPNPLERARLGLAVSKRHARHAVTRNRIKRVIRESFRTTGSIAEVDYVVMITAKGASASNAELFDSLQRHWRTIRSRCERS